jgi:hypothetical protein
MRALLLEAAFINEMEAKVIDAANAVKLAKKRK